jgi:hypothetical protein
MPEQGMSLSMHPRVDHWVLPLPSIFAIQYIFASLLTFQSGFRDRSPVALSVWNLAYCDNVQLGLLVSLEISLFTDAGDGRGRVDLLIHSCSLLLSSVTTNTVTVHIHLFCQRELPDT